MLAKLKLEVKDFRERLDNVFGYLEDENITKAEPILNKLIKDYGEKDKDIQEALIILKDLKQFKEEVNKEEEINTWKYGLKRYNSNYSDNSDKDLYEITEIIGGTSWVEDSLSLIGESPKEVIEMLELMLYDLKSDLTVVDDDSIKY